MSSVVRSCVAAGGVLGATAVLAGAFGAHGLETLLKETNQAANWETASRYALVHAVAVVATGVAAALPDANRSRRMLAAAAWCFVAGVVIFSGCLWALALTRIRMLGAVVPVGGSLLVAGWVALAVAGARCSGGSPDEAAGH